MTSRPRARSRPTRRCVAAPSSACARAAPASRAFTRTSTPRSRKTPTSTGGTRTEERELAERYAALDKRYEDRYRNDFPEDERALGPDGKPESALTSAMRESFTWGSGKAAFNFTTSTADLDILLSYQKVGQHKDDANIDAVFRTHLAETSAARVQYEHRSIWAGDKEINSALADQYETAYKDRLRDEKLKLEWEENVDRNRLAQARRGRAHAQGDPAQGRARQARPRAEGPQSQVGARGRGLPRARAGAQEGRERRGAGRRQDEHGGAPPDLGHEIPGLEPPVQLRRGQVVRRGRARRYRVRRLARRLRGRRRRDAHQRRARRGAPAPEGRRRSGTRDPHRRQDARAPHRQRLPERGRQTLLLGQGRGHRRGNGEGGLRRRGQRGSARDAGAARSPPGGPVEELPSSRPPRRRRPTKKLTPG